MIIDEKTQYDDDYMDEDIYIKIYLTVKIHINGGSCWYSFSDECNFYIFLAITYTFVFV